jgi:hypothetical protein
MQEFQWDFIVFSLISFTCPVFIVRALNIHVPVFGLRFIINVLYRVLFLSYRKSLYFRQHSVTAEVLISTLKVTKSSTINMILTYIFTDLLTLWDGVLLEKLTGSQLVKKFSTLNGTRRFITTFTSAHHLSLS